MDQCKRHSHSQKPEDTESKKAYKCVHTFILGFTQCDNKTSPHASEQYSVTLWVQDREDRL